MSPASHPRIEDYVRRLLRPLENTVDQEHFEEVRTSTVFHLELLAEDLRDHPDPIGAALAKYGTADELGMATLDEWCRGRQALTFAKASSAACWWSFAFFGIAAGVVLLLVEVTTLWPGGAALEPIAAGVAWLAPAVAGFLTGRHVPTGNLRAFGVVTLALILHALVAILLIGPYLVRAQLVAYAIPGWIPIGALSLVLSAWLRRHLPARHRTTSRLGAPL